MTHTHVVPTMFHRLLALDDETRARHDLVVVAPRRARRRAVPGRREAGHDRVGGSGDRRVLRGHRGRGNARRLGDLAAQAGHRRQAVPGRPGDRRRRRRTTAARRRGRHRVAEEPAGRRVRVLPRRREDRPCATRTVVHARRPRLRRRRRLPLPLRPQRRAHHLGRGEHLPGRDRRGAARAPRRRATRRRSASPTTSGARRCSRSSRSIRAPPRHRPWRPSCSRSVGSGSRPSSARDRSSSSTSSPARTTARSTAASCATALRQEKKRSRRTVVAGRRRVSDRAGGADSTITRRRSGAE